MIRQIKHTEMLHCTVCDRRFDAVAGKSHTCKAELGTLINRAIGRCNGLHSTTIVGLNRLGAQWQEDYRKFARVLLMSRQNGNSRIKSAETADRFLDSALAKLKESSHG